MLDAIIKGGTVVTPQGAAIMDVAVQDGKIAALSHPGLLGVEAVRVIDASDKIVLPGGIEPHTHIGIPVPEQWAGRPEVFTQPPELPFSTSPAPFPSPLANPCPRTPS